MRTLTGKLLFVLALLGFAFYSSYGYGMDSKQRLAIIKGLKLNGAVGENNKGFLEFRTDDKKAAAVVDEENAERKKAYAEIAKKTGTSVDAVGAQRAAQIAKEESAGVWVQDAEGKWAKK